MLGAVAPIVKGPRYATKMPPKQSKKAAAAEVPASTPTKAGAGGRGSAAGSVAGSVAGSDDGAASVVVGMGKKDRERAGASASPAKPPENELGVSILSILEGYKPGRELTGVVALMLWMLSRHRTMTVWLVLSQ